ncbi:GAF domain-containing sensor histidine kinase [Dyella halodurans]|uniref:histidine kinase n=1 Tax=Dyella halodurans TaxID=1920171 RepID=A0ABV9BZX7_9GAMM|nr:GAF domain-containing sensor histidine kinase [Dyella halodurans]
MQSIDADHAVALIGRLEAIPRILEVVAHTTGMGFTAVARVTDRSWTACAVYDRMDFGLKPGDELDLGTTICNEIREHQRPVVFGRASEHPYFSGHPTPKMYGFESYVSIPIILSDGSFFGTLCAIDPAPAKLDDPNILKTFELFTTLIAAQFEAELRRHRAEAALLDAQETAKLREQFVAVLGHDLGNPLQSIIVCAEHLSSTLVSDSDLRLTRHILATCRRIGELTHNVLDFARGRLGEGIAVQPEVSDELAVSLEHVVSEVRSIYPDRRIELTISLRHPVLCDRQRVAQLLCNLLSNALVHGIADAPVKVSLSSDASAFEVAVENACAPIAPETLGRLFQPFTRGTFAEPRPGLGLGLFISSEIAKAHGGTLMATSDPLATRFVFRLQHGASVHHAC